MIFTVTSGGNLDFHASPTTITANKIAAKAKKCSGLATLFMVLYAIPRTSFIGYSATADS